MVLLCGFAHFYQDGAPSLELCCYDLHYHLRERVAISWRFVGFCLFAIGCFLFPWRRRRSISIWRWFSSAVVVRSWWRCADCVHFVVIVRVALSSDFVSLVLRWRVLRINALESFRDLVRWCSVSRLGGVFCRVRSARIDVVRLPFFGCFVLLPSRCLRVMAFVGSISLLLLLFLAFSGIGYGLRLFSAIGVSYRSCMVS